MLFSKRIVEELSSKNITQKQLAQQLKISESNISNWKNGTNVPSLEIFCQLCKILDVSADYLLGLTDYID